MRNDSKFITDLLNKTTDEISGMANLADSNGRNEVADWLIGNCDVLSGLIVNTANAIVNEQHSGTVHFLDIMFKKFSSRMDALEAENAKLRLAMMEEEEEDITNPLDFNPLKAQEDEISDPDNETLMEIMSEFGSHQLGEYEWIDGGREFNILLQADFRRDVYCRIIKLDKHSVTLKKDGSICTHTFRRADGHDILHAKITRL